MPERRGEGARGWVFTTAKIRVLADKNLDFPGKLAGRLPQNSQKIIPVSKVGLTLPSFRIRTGRSDRRLVSPTPARRASGTGNWDQPRHTTGSGRPLSESPTYSAFWSVSGVTCLRSQRLASSMGFGTTGASGAPEEPPGFGPNLRAY